MNIVRVCRRIELLLRSKKLLVGYICKCPIFVIGLFKKIPSRWGVDTGHLEFLPHKSDRLAQ